MLILPNVIKHFGLLVKQRTIKKHFFFVDTRLFCGQSSKFYMYLLFYYFESFYDVTFEEETFEKKLAVSAFKRTNGGFKRFLAF